jgi:hypothetical protein
MALLLEGEAARARMNTLDPDWIATIDVYREQCKYPEAYAAAEGKGLIVITLKEAEVSRQWRRWFREQAE